MIRSTKYTLAAALVVAPVAVGQAAQLNAGDTASVPVLTPYTAHKKACLGIGNTAACTDPRGTGTREGGQALGSYSASQVAASRTMLHCLALQTAQALDTCDPVGVIVDRVEAQCNGQINQYLATFGGLPVPFTVRDFRSSVATSVATVRQQGQSCQRG